MLRRVNCSFECRYPLSEIFLLNPVKNICDCLIISIQDTYIFFSGLKPLNMQSTEPGRIEGSWDQVMEETSPNVVLPAFLRLSIFGLFIISVTQ